MIPNLGEKVRSLRDEKGMSKELLAGLAGISVSRIEQLEKGYPGGMRVNTLCSIAKALGVPPSTLIDGDESAA